MAIFAILIRSERLYQMARWGWQGSETMRLGSGQHAGKVGVPLKPSRQQHGTFSWCRYAKTFSNSHASSIIGFAPTLTSHRRHPTPEICRLCPKAPYQGMERVREKPTQSGRESQTGIQCIELLENAIEVQRDRFRPVLTGTKCYYCLPGASVVHRRRSRVCAVGFVS